MKITLAGLQLLAYRVLNVALGTAGLFCLGMCLWRVLALDWTGAGVLAGISVGLLIVATVERFESFKLFGVEAKVRKLDEKLQEANDLTARLKTLAGLSGATLMDLASKVGRFDSATGPAQAISLADQVRNLLEGVGASPEAIAAAMKPWAQTMSFDYVYALLCRVDKAHHEALARLRGTDQAQQAQVEVDRWNVAAKEIRSKRDPDKYAEALPDLFAQLPQLAADQTAAFKGQAQTVCSELQALAADGKIRTPELWIRNIEESRQ